jgi:hypothetical protein
MFGDAGQHLAEVAFRIEPIEFRRPNE